MNVLQVTIVTVGAMLMAWVAIDHADKRAMEICQMTHSYETCFTTLNR